MTVIAAESRSLTPVERRNKFEARKRKRPETIHARLRLTLVYMSSTLDDIGDRFYNSEEASQCRMNSIKFAPRFL
jgi:hypothetical protein